MEQPLPASVLDRIRRVVELAAPVDMLGETRRQFAALALTEAVARHDTAALFDWLIQVLSYQGVSDAIAWAYMDQHGTVTYADIAAALHQAPFCRKLTSRWHFEGCRYAKQAFTCAEPALVGHCPLPQHDLRNGRLNQTAYSLFLFLRDVCEGDLVGWVDARLAAANRDPGLNRLAAMRQALLEPLSAIYGISYKVLSMALADLLLAGDPGRGLWVETGASMVAIDTLVHNLMHRTGNLRELGTEHTYGPGCYAPGGCASIIEAASSAIDARRFCPEGPAIFPRLVQKALWLFCTEAGQNVCNGNQVDDQFACSQTSCSVSSGCGRVALRGMEDRR